MMQSEGLEASLLRRAVDCHGHEKKPIVLKEVSKAPPAR
jgi:hypothetical protein